LTLADKGFPKTSRLLCAKDYGPVFNSARFRISNRHCLILAIYNDRPNSRLGIVVAKKNIASAVERNRIKRIIRESFRLSKPGFATIDIVVLVKRGLDCLSNREISKQIIGLYGELSTKEVPAK
jgi:ribonuclease P protein component